jgi:hypothetical protein
VKTLPEHTTATAHQHETDFYTWTQEQAALLRRVPRGAFALDIDNLAEEIEDIGRGEIREVSSLPRQVLMHPWPTACPLGLDDILATEFDLGRMLERVKSALHATAANRPH